MAFTSQKNLGNLLTGELNNNMAFRSGANSIGLLANDRMKKLFAKYASTGMGRTGVGGAAASEIYADAGNSLNQLAGSEADRRSRLIDQMLGLYKYGKEQDAKKIGIGDVLGSSLGLVAGSALGGVGGGIGSALSKLITG